MLAVCSRIVSGVRVAVVLEMEVTLPLIYANGRFAHPDEMTDSQMERFITFLVRCSCGYDTTHEVYEPEWWLPNLPFVYPLARPKKVTGKWTSDLKNLIQRCYKYHKYEYLLNLSQYLWEHQKKDNIVITPVQSTSETRLVYLKSNDTVIATVRNINVTYDEYFFKFVDPNEHDLVSEKHCRELEQTSFLEYFRLRQKDDVFVPVAEPQERNISSRTFYNATNIPFSSQLGRRLALRSKYFVNEKTHLKRLERINRYLNNTDLNSIVNDVNSEGGPQTGFKYKSSNCWMHDYKFKTGIKRNWTMRTKILYNTCKDCEVRIIPLKDSFIARTISSIQNKCELGDLSCLDKKIDLDNCTTGLLKQTNDTVKENLSGKNKNTNKLKLKLVTRRKKTRRKRVAKEASDEVQSDLKEIVVNVENNRIIPNNIYVDVNKQVISAYTKHNSKTNTINENISISIVEVPSTSKSNTEKKDTGRKHNRKHVTFKNISVGSPVRRKMTLRPIIVKKRPTENKL